MQNPILARLARPDPIWLLNLITVLEVERYSLDDWNEALSAVLGHRISCPSYRALSRRIQEEVLGHC